jgi:hypothetical protein
MQTHTRRVRDSILSRSVANTLPKAFHEWFFTDEMVDHEIADESCQLCGTEWLRYLFEIENELTHHKLWVCSHCIVEFKLAVYEGTERLSLKAAEIKLNKLIDKMRVESSLRALEQLAAARNNEILRGELSKETGPGKS